jgi:flagellin
MSVINTNVKALVAQESMRSNNLKLSTAMERLSTGLRINSAKDDAAGLAISNRMTAQIRGMSMAIKNANDGISMAQTADGAYGQVTSMLQRMRELAVQAANGAVSGSDRESIQLEIEELKAEINNVAERTNFNGIKLLDGTARDIKLQTGTNEGELMSVGFGSAKTTDIGSGLQPALTSVGGIDDTFGALADGDLVINGVLVGDSLATDDSLSTGLPAEKAASSIAKAAAINRVTEFSGVYARVNETVALGTSMSAAPAALTGTVTINGYTTASFSVTTDNSTSRANVVKAVNDIAAASGVRAVDSGDDQKGVLLIADDGRNIALSFSTAGGAALNSKATGLAVANTHVGTYSLYSKTGDAITVDHQVGKTQAEFQRTGLRLGTFESDKAIAVTTNRAAATAGFTAGSTSGPGVLSGDTLVINDVAIAAARTTDDTASFTSSTDTASINSNSAIAIAAAINRSTDLHGVTAKAEANVLRGTSFLAQTAAQTAGTLTLNGVAIVTHATTRNDVIDSINAVSGQTGVVASAFGEGIELRAEDGRNITLKATSTLSNENLGLGGVTVASTAGAGAAHYASVSLTSDKAFTVAQGDEGSTSAGVSNFERLGFREGTFGGSDTGVKIAEIDVTTQLGAGIAITAVDAAIEDIAASQARSGAFQNRLDASVSVLSEQSENAQAARGRILDTDYATETTALAKAQIVQQAATAMLAQANQQQQSVLALLQ